jgi:hypothetical protein
MTGENCVMRSCLICTCQANVIQVIKAVMRWEGHVARVGEKRKEFCWTSEVKNTTWKNQTLVGE